MHVAKAALLGAGTVLAANLFADKFRSMLPASTPAVLANNSGVIVGALVGVAAAYALKG